MKLYATVTSERATKGQGGNKELHITILRKINGENVPVYFIGVWPDEMVVEHIPSQGEVYRETKGKGEKQKGEKRICGHCGCQLGEHDDLIKSPHYLR